MTATPARLLSLGNLLVFSPLGLSFVDDFTGLAQIGSVTPTLVVETPPGSGVYVSTGVTGLFTNSGILAYPNLGRRERVPKPAEAPRKYRISIDAQYYTPLYPTGLNAPGFDFTVTPYDNNTDFATATPPITPTRETIRLLPKANYPFAGNAQLLRGKVETASNAPVRALVTIVEPYDDSGDTNQTRVATDSGGAFLVPLRWGDAKSPKPTTVTATSVDPVSGKSLTGQLTLAFPYDLSASKTINIS
jgi:hypothetical protein